MANINGTIDPKGIDNEPMIRKYVKVGKENTIDTSTIKKDRFLNLPGISLYKRINPNPVILIVSVKVKIGLYALKITLLKNQEYDKKLIISKINKITHGLINHL